MTVLKMKGQPITNMLKLRQCFDPYDMVRQRDAFFAFAKGHLLLSSDSIYLHAIAATLLSGGKATGFYYDAALGTPEARMQKLSEINGDTFWNNTLDFKIAHEKYAMNTALLSAEQLALPKTVYAWCSANILDESARQSLFLILTTGYLLAGVDLPAQMPDAEELMHAFRNTDNAAYGSQELELPPVNGRGIRKVELTASLYLASRFMGKPQQNDRIQSYWLVSTARKPSALRLDRKTYPISGDIGLFVNAINGKIVQILPNSVRNGNASITRKPDCLVTQNGNRQVRRIAVSADAHISSFAVSANADSVLYIQNNALIMDRYAGEAVLTACANRTIVEVAISGDRYCVLTDNTRVFSNDKNWHYRLGMVNLDGF